MGMMEFVKREAREEGRIEGARQKEIEVVKGLLDDPGFSIRKIAKIARVSVAFVKEVAKEKN